MPRTILDFVNRANSALDEAHRILSVHEAAPSRVVLLDDTYNKLERLSLSQDELVRQSLRCIEKSLNRAAHILAWTALIDLIENILASDGFKKLRSVRKKWKISSLDDFRESVTEYQVIEACRDVAFVNKGEMKLLHGLLNKRNLCAHPSNFYPNYNQTLGFVADVLDMAENLRRRSY